MTHASKLYLNVTHLKDFLLLSEYTTKVNRDTCWFINQNQKYTDITLCPHQAPVVQQHVGGVCLCVEADQVQVLVNVDQLSICVCIHLCVLL